MSILDISSGEVYLLPLDFTVQEERNESIPFFVTTQLESRLLSNFAETLKGVERLLFCEERLMRDEEKYDGRILEGSKRKENGVQEHQREPYAGFKCRMRGDMLSSHIVLFRALINLNRRNFVHIVTSHCLFLRGRHARGNTAPVR